MKDQGKFEIAKFHGMNVAIFDSHWFANRIIEKEGADYMCHEINLAATDLYKSKLRQSNVYAVTLSFISMQPYHDFMAVCKKENSSPPRRPGLLRDLFTLPEDSAYPSFTFRLETARRMLAAPPIRYCIPFTVEIINTPTIELI